MRSTRALMKTVRYAEAWQGVEPTNCDAGGLHHGVVEP
jgi:hypothetical protein